MNKFIAISKTILGSSLVLFLGMENVSADEVFNCRGVFASASVLSARNPVLENAIVAKEVVDQLAGEFGAASKQPQDLKVAFEAFQRGAMSLSLFKKLVSEYPKPKGSVSILFLKSHLRSLNIENGYPANAKAIIEEAFGQFKKTFQFGLETEDFYIVETPLKDASDVKFLGTLATSTIIGPLIFQSDEGLPTKRFFKLPSSVFRDLNETVVQLTHSHIGPRYGIINAAEVRNNMSYEALKAVAEYDGSKPLILVYSVSKKSLEKIKATEPKYQQIDLAKMVEIDGLDLLDSIKGKYSRLPETEESVIFKITIQNVSEIQAIRDLFDLGLESKFSLPEQ